MDSENISPVVCSLDTFVLFLLCVRVGKKVSFQIRSMPFK